MQSKEPCAVEPALDYLFSPESVAVVGVSDDMSRPNGGRIFTETLIKGGYRGQIYPVGLGGGEVFGLKIYPTVRDIPDNVDYVISAIPAQYTPQLLHDSAARGVKVVHMFTAGFSEVGDDRGRQLEAEVTTTARRLGLRIIGPNCMGLYCPKSGLSFCTEFSTRSGPVGYIAQSGGHSLYGVLEANSRGIYFSKVISFGNACDLNESDYLEYLTEDAETEIIALYIEGVKDARRFVAALKRAARLKPVMVYKGGATAGGARMVSSHTGAMAGSYTTWSSLIRQAGAVPVRNVPELVDMLLLFQHLSPPTGRNVAIMGVGGGASVQATDDCLNAGLAVPLLPAEVSQRLKSSEFTEAGKIFKNPVDFFSHGSRQFIQHIMRVLGSSSQIDFLMPHVSFDQYPSPEVREVRLYLEALGSLPPEIKARTAVVLYTVVLPHSRQAAAEAELALAEAGLAVFPSFARAANALAKFVAYHQRRCSC